MCYTSVISCYPDGRILWYLRRKQSYPKTIESVKFLRITWIFENCYLFVHATQIPQFSPRLGHSSGPKPVMKSSSRRWTWRWRLWRPPTTKNENLAIDFLHYRRDNRLTWLITIWPVSWAAAGWISRTNGSVGPLRRYGFPSGMRIYRGAGMGRGSGLCKAVGQVGLPQRVCPFRAGNAYLKKKVWTIWTWRWISHSPRRGLTYQTGYKNCHSLARSVNYWLLSTMNSRSILGCMYLCM